MSGQKLPIKFSELLQLSRVGVQPASISFNNLSMCSEKWICIREKVGEQSQVVMIPTANPAMTVRKPITADAAIMNPKSNILALAAGNQVQVFNMDARSKLGEQTIASPIVFWTWIDETTIAYVTADAVYHWAVTTAGSAPQKMFDRLPQLGDAQIIAYRVDVSKKWLALVGIAQRDGQIAGSIQLYSVDRAASQSIDGHAAAFMQYRVQTESGAVASAESTLFAIATKKGSEAKLLVLEVAAGDADKHFARVSVDMAYPPECVGADFPVALQVSAKNEMIFVVTKMGHLYMYHAGTGSLVFRNRISAEAIFTSAPQASTDGMLCVNRKGQVFSISVDTQNIVPYIVSTLNEPALGIKLAGKCDLPGADGIFTEQFNRLLAAGQIKEAAGIAIRSPGTSIRNEQTIQRLQQIPVAAGQPSPLLVYFATLLDLGRLNKLESVELSKLLISQNRVQLLEQWLQQNKFECSEQMGDLLRTVNPTLALQVYHLANASGKVVQLLAETGQQDKIAAYCQKTGYSPDFKSVLSTMLPNNSAVARDYAVKYAAEHPDADLNPIIDEFMKYNLVQDVTSFLLDALKGDRAEQGKYQTRLFEINLPANAAVVDAILGNKMFHHYDRHRVAQLCEQAGLNQRALEHYTEMPDIKRVLARSSGLPPEFFVEFFSQRSPEESLELLEILLRAPGGPRQNLQIVVQVAVAYYAQLTPAKVIEMFEKFKSYEGMYYFLNKIVGLVDDPEVHYHYIEASCRVGQFQEVERMCRESNNYDPARVRDLLKGLKLADQLPLIIVCDRFNFVEDLATYLYQQGLSRYIEAYVQKINPANTPAVVGALLDAGCSEDYIKALILSVRTGCPADKLIETVQSRNRLKIILPWLEQRASEGNSDPALHNALVMCYIDLNREPEKYLEEDLYYDPRAVGAYCEGRNPYLAYVAYRHGKCDDELLAVTNANALYKYEARYLVERQDADLWARVLDDAGPYAEHKKAVVEQVVHGALPESTDPEEVKATVKAFILAHMPSELIELLEKIVLDGRRPEFAENKDLQDLLIITATDAARDRVMDFVTRLDNYDAQNMASICITKELYEEAFAILKRFKYNKDAIGVLIDNIHDLKRASDFADKCNEPEVYSRLGKAQLDAGAVREAIAAFLKADDHEFYDEVIAACESAEVYDDLVTYLCMCRKKVKEQTIESELLFAYAKTGRLTEIEEFLATPNSAAIQVIGDRCFSEALFEAAKLLYASINNYVRLASTLIKLKDYNEAVEAARKANSTTTWREVTVACLDAQEFRLAQTCALNIIVHSDEICDCISQYERRGYFDEAITLLETGITLERAHPGMYTELAILYSKFHEEKLMDYVRLNVAKLLPAKLIRVCRDNMQWPVLTFLYVSGEDYDHAVEVMIDHSTEAWDHVLFRDSLAKVKKSDLLYRAVDFYLLEQPKRVNELLQALVQLFDPAVVVDRARRRFVLPLIKPYLALVQKDVDVIEVNEALNEILIEEGDHAALRASIELRASFDHGALAKQLESHEALEFRRIAVFLYATSKRYKEAIELSKKDEMWADAMDSAAKSGDRDLAEDLLRFFVEKDIKGCFVATLYACYDLVRPDVVLELAWRNKLVDLIVPFMIQTIRETSSRIETLEKKEAAREKAEKEAAEKKTKNAAFDVPQGAPGMMAGPGGFGMLALPAPTAPAAAAGPAPGMGMGMGMGMNMGGPAPVVDPMFANSASGAMPPMNMSAQQQQPGLF